MNYGNCVAIYDKIDNASQHHDCIYMYINKINNKKYVGQAKDFLSRNRKHLKGKKQLIDNKIREYGKENFAVVILRENVPTKCAKNIFEVYYIDKYNTMAKNNCGYNIADGGHNGNAWASKTDEEFEAMKNKVSKANIGNQYNLGRKRSEVSKRRQSEAITGRKLTEEHKAKVGKASKMVWEREDYRNARSGGNARQARAVAKYTWDGKFIKSYGCIKDAVAENGSLSDVFNGECKHSHGFQWRYFYGDTSDIEPLERNPLESRKVVQFTKNMEFVRIWDSTKHIIDELHLTNLHKNLNRKTKSCGGYIWRYLDEVDIASYEKAD